MNMNMINNIFLRKPTNIAIETPPEDGHHLQVAHYTLFDLLSIGVGGTVGSGVFVLNGLIANKYAGPSVIFCWIIGGIGCILSGLSFAEMASRIPSEGSGYAYSYVVLGEIFAYIAGWLLTLEFGISAAAISRNWGEKVIIWLNSLEIDLPWILDPSNLKNTMNNNNDNNNDNNDMINNMNNDDEIEYNFFDSINVFAAILQTIVVFMMLYNVSVSKVATNFLTVLKCVLILWMTIMGFVYFKIDNLTPLIPSVSTNTPNFGGIQGIFRGTTTAFFGFLGFDEVCVLGAESVNPRRDVPLAVFGTIFLVTFFHGVAAIALVGMQNYEDIDVDSGFVKAFEFVNCSWMAHFTAIGELLCLPVVVLVSFLAQPRILYAMSEDGLLPKLFRETNADGILIKGTLVSGVLCIFVALMFPFDFISDMVSAGVILALNMTNSCVIVVNRQNEKNENLSLLLVGVLNVSMAVTCQAMVRIGMSSFLAIFSLMIMVMTFCSIVSLCPQIPSSSSSNNNNNEEKGFTAPLVPYLTSIGMFLNWYLVAQLDWSQSLMLIGYIGIAVVFYFMYGYHHSRGNKYGWKHLSQCEDDYENTTTDTQNNMNESDLTTPLMADSEII